MSLFVRHQLLPLLIIIACVLVGAWVARWTWTDRLPPTYLNHLYDHSQWQIAQSPRIIADDLLYQVAGTRLMQGANPTTINPEVPPLGKYIYGFAEQNLGSPYIAALLATLFLGWGFILLAEVTDLSPRRKLVMTVLLMSSALVLTQLQQTMQDIFQAASLVWHIWALLKIAEATSKARRVGYAVVTGLTLGIFAAVKFPLLVPLILVIDTWWLIRHKLISYLFVTLTICTAVYVGSYWSFFAQGASLRAWLGTQKWMLDFYLKSNTQTTPGLFIISVLTGWWRGWWGAPWQRISEWSIVWPAAWVGAIGTTTYLYTDKKRRQSLLQPTNYLLLSVIALISLVFLIIPFWARYFIVLLPFCLIFIGRVFPKIHTPYQPLLKIVLAVVVIMQLLQTSIATPTRSIELAVEVWQKGQSQDLYWQLLPARRESISEYTFTHQLEILESQIGTPKLTIGHYRWQPWQSEVTIPVEVQYQTQLGSYTHYTSWKFSKHQGKWWFDWSWDTVLPNFSESGVVTQTIEPPKNGRILTKDLLVILEDAEVPQFQITPQKYTTFEETWLGLAKLTGLSKFELINILHTSSLPDLPVTLNLPHFRGNTADLQRLATQSGIVQTSKIQLSPTEIAHNALLELNVQALTTKYPQLVAQPRGVITVSSSGKVTTVMETEGRAGQDVILHELLSELSTTPLSK